MGVTCSSWTGRRSAWGTSSRSRKCRGPSPPPSSGQRLLAWGPTYQIHRNGELAATVKKELFSFFKHRFEVDVPGPDDLEAEGAFMDPEHTVRRGGRVVD